MAHSDPMVTAEWLQAHLSDDEVRIVDATWVPPFVKTRPPGAESFAEAHIPGAVYFDIDAIADQNSGLSHMLPSAEQFAEQVSALGIGSAHEVIVYDSNGLFAAARVWWMFRAMGHDQVRVLNGGLDAWRTIGGEIARGVAASPSPAEFAAKLVPNLVRDMTAMRAHSNARDVAILDARTQGRFDGTAPEPRAGLPSGHMPGSFCVPVTALLEPDTWMKTPEQLRPVLAPHLDSDIVTTCGSGVSAAIISLALARVGHWEAALYDGSWSEWAANADNLIETTS